MLGEQRKINPAAIPGGTQGMAVARHYIKVTAIATSGISRRVSGGAVSTGIKNRQAGCCVRVRVEWKTGGPANSDVSELTFRDGIFFIYYCYRPVSRNIYRRTVRGETYAAANTP